VSRAKKPRATDVARWVADIAAPEPSTWNRWEHSNWKNKRDNARGMLASWGLGHDGQPKAERVAS
jgi:hypothetical protein